MMIELPVWLAWIIVLMLGIPIAGFLLSALVVGAYMLLSGRWM